MTVAALLLEMCQISRACMFMELLLWRLTIHAPKTMVLTANDAFKKSLSSVAVDVCSPESYFSPIQLGFTVGNVNFKVRDTWRLVDNDLDLAPPLRFRLKIPSGDFFTISNSISGSFRPWPQAFAIWMPTKLKF